MTDTKQILIISDIERIKKVVEVLEFVGEKIDVILENFPISQSQASRYEKELGKTEYLIPTTTMDTTNIT